MAPIGTPLTPERSRFIPLHTSGGPIPLIKSAFTWHNETGTWSSSSSLSFNGICQRASADTTTPVNIHSHFVPTVLILLAIPVSCCGDVSPLLPSPRHTDTYFETEPAASEVVLL
jgi:hypothetical protein